LTARRWRGHRKPTFLLNWDIHRNCAAGAFARLGIVNEVAAKAKLWKSVQQVTDERSADLLINWQPPLLSKAADYEFVGPLPPELQDPEHSTWTAGAATKAADLGAAKGLTQVLASSESLGVFKGKGFTPP